MVGTKLKAQKKYTFGQRFCIGFKKQWILHLMLLPMVVFLLVYSYYLMAGILIATLIYVPYFLSWVVLSGILIDILSPTSGIVNQILGYVGIEPIFFLGDEDLFPWVLIVTDVWKNFGYGTVVYLAAITSIDPSLYEAAKIDGANRLKLVMAITLPGLMPMIVLMATLSLGNILNAGFEQVLNLYSPSVMSTGDIIDTFVYRIGLENSQYGIASAMGLFKSAVSLAFISIGYWLAYKFADYRVF